MVRKINDVAVLKFTVDGKDFEKACKVLSIYIKDENKKMRIMENEHFKQESYLDDNGKTILEKNVALYLRECRFPVISSTSMRATIVFASSIMLYAIVFIPAGIL